MKSAIHPQIFETTIHCNGCNTTFTTHATVERIDVEICSNCHPFYTGKQKLIDTAGRVDKFKARQAKASEHAISRAAKPAKPAEKKEVELLAKEIEAGTVDTPAASKPKTAKKPKTEA